MALTLAAGDHRISFCIALNSADVGATRPCPRRTAALVGEEILGVGPLVDGGAIRLQGDGLVGPPFAARPAAARSGFTPTRFVELTVPLIGVVWNKQ